MLHYFKTNKYKSPNFGERAGGQNASMAIIHYTGLESAEQALAWLCDPGKEVSAHYVIDEVGRLHHLVDNDKRAWHAGLSSWEGEADINSASIGIELVNPGHEFGYKEFPQKQVDVLVALLSDLVAGYSIRPNHILGHSDVAPGRKQDPGHLFPWQQLSEKGFGLWPHPNEHDYQAAEDIVLDVGRVQGLLVGFGYTANASHEELFMAFHRHFYPEKFDCGGAPDQVDIASVAKLLSLLRQKSEL